MAIDYLHHHPEFEALIRITAEEQGMPEGLVEKDYWIMHVLFGLSKMGLHFELKGGTSLSKGYGIIDRFSEDIDIHIKAPEHLQVDDNPSNNSDANVKSRAAFYEWLTVNIKIDGIHTVARDHEFDDPSGKYRSGGIRLNYTTHADPVEAVKEGILLEAGYDTVTPNRTVIISSWAFDRAWATEGIHIIDNRALGIVCYHPGYTFVEKLQTIASKFRQEKRDGKVKKNYMRQYYDIFCLLNDREVQEFIGTAAYFEHKKLRFPAADYNIPIAENEAFVLADPILRKQFAERYSRTRGLYYKGQIPFEDLLKRIAAYADRL